MVSAPLFRRFSLILALSLAPAAYALDQASSESLRSDDALVAEAIRYEHGEGVAKDPGKAAELYCSAARGGDADAAYRLGWMYANGRGLERHDDFAAALFQRAAGGGHAYAARTLQLIHAQDAQLPPCMTPPPVVPDVLEADGNSDLPFPSAWLGDKNRVKVVELARKLAPQYDVDPRLVLAIINAESAFETSAVSPRNAQGLMQLIPETAARFQVKKILDPADNMRGGIAYLRWLLAYFEGDVQLTLAAYNAGEKAVERYRGIPPYSETRLYVERVARLYGRMVHRFDARIVAASPMMAARRLGPAKLTALRE